MSTTIKKAARLVCLAIASLPLMQVACTTDAFVQSFTSEIADVAAVFAFDVSQTIINNFLGI